ncbi:uncharacterized protein [Phaseolus vulgaris]|uniref:uncharacterized protein n=1 Tax=Phaseolus vulgaris TaxID=3885 RepID=UPI0035CC63A9
MKIFVESIDQGIWDAIENGPFIPRIEKAGSFTRKPWSQWTNEETKEMWDTLEVIHEGTNENEEKMLSMLFKKLRKFLKKRINKRNSSKRLDKQKKKGKSRKVCNDDSSSISSSEVEKANLCLMAKNEDHSSSESSVSSSPSLNAENYSQLLQAFKETHEEANRLALLNNRLKGKIDGKHATVVSGQWLLKTHDKG